MARILIAEDEEGQRLEAEAERRLLEELRIRRGAERGRPESADAVGHVARHDRVGHPVEEHPALPEPRDRQREHRGDGEQPPAGNGPHENGTSLGRRGGKDRDV